jgi:hypothetical protein
MLEEVTADATADRKAGGGSRPSPIEAAVVKDLVEEIRAKRMCIIAGAGVTLAVTENADTAGWAGLLRSGVDHVGRGALTPPEWQGWVLGLCNSKDQDDLLTAASEVRHYLATQGEYAGWLRASIGALRTQKVGLLQSIVDLHTMLGTTNYDDLLARHAGRQSITWRQPALLARAIRAQDDAVIHLHGKWEEPDSVILDSDSYDQILSNDLAQVALRVLVFSKTLLFVGCGAGLEDRNFRTLRQWMERVCAPLEHHHFRLVTRMEREQLIRLHRRDRIVLVEYGESHDDLESFLRQLAVLAHGAPAPGPSRLSSLSGTWSGFWLWKGRPRNAELVLVDENPTVATMKVQYERDTVVTTVRLRLHCERSGAELQLRVVAHEFVERGTARRWIPDEFRLVADPADPDVLVGWKWEAPNPERKEPVSFRRKR